MSNSYTSFALHDSIPCSRELADRIIALLEQPVPEDDLAHYEPHGISAEYDGKEVYLYGEEFANADNLPNAVLDLIGQALREAGKEYIGFGEGWYSDRCSPCSAGGRTGRIYADGVMEIPEPIFTYDSNLQKHP